MSTPSTRGFHSVPRSSLFKALALAGCVVFVLVLLSLGADADFGLRPMLPLRLLPLLLLRTCCRGGDRRVPAEVNDGVLMYLYLTLWSTVMQRGWLQYSSSCADAYPLA